MPLVLLMRVVEGSCARPGNSPNAGAFSSACQSANCRTARCANAYTLSGVDVAPVSNPAPITAVMMALSGYSR